MCGETEVVAGDLRIKMMSLQKRMEGDPSGLTGYHKQFKVECYSHIVKCFAQIIAKSLHTNMKLHQTQMLTIEMNR